MSEEEITFSTAFHQDIVIRASHNGGYVVTVGCGVFTYSKDEEEMLTRHLLNYLRDPKGITGRYNDFVDGQQPEEPIGYTAGDEATPMPATR